jgi:hypothetical protein
VFDIGKQIAPRHAVAPQLIGHDHPRRILQTIQKAPEEALGRATIAPILNKNIEDNTMLIDGTPEIVLYSLDSDKNFVHVPLVSRLGPAAAQAISENPAEFFAPSPHCLIGDDNAESDHAV